MSPLDTPFDDSSHWLRLGDVYEVTKKPRGLDMLSTNKIPFAPMAAIPQGGAYAPDYALKPATEIRSGTYFERGDVLGCQDYAIIRKRQAGTYCCVTRTIRYRNNGSYCATTAKGRT